MKTTVVHHSADFDGIFCREVARKFLPSDTEFIGWDYNDPKLVFPPEGIVYVLDLSPDCFDSRYSGIDGARFIWIDHHKTAIDKYGTLFPGYRIDGVAACRLAYQWFLQQERKALGMIWLLPDKTEYVERRTEEPIAVRLAGEYDIWDKRDDRAETFQYGLRSRLLLPVDYQEMLTGSANITELLLEDGKICQRYQRNCDREIMGSRSFRVTWEGLNFICLNSAFYNSLSFAALDVPESGHDALMGFRFDGSQFTFSLYHAKHRPDIDLSLIAAKHGGGGHRGACGFRLPELPFPIAK